MEIRKNLILFIILFTLLATSCGKDTVTIENKHTTKKQDNSYKIIDNNNTVSILKIDEKCIGCGKCIMVASDNFAMDISTLKAKVISQKNIFGSKVSNAIKVCPANSISRS